MNEIQTKKELKVLFPIQAKTAMEIIEDILVQAAHSRASDIHIDPRIEDILIRLRIDGVMEEAGVLSKDFHEEMIARLKILSGARTDIHAIPQDGRWRACIASALYNVRVSFMPTYNGENAVVRLLPARPLTELSFARLGFTPEHVQAIDRALQATTGLILVAGPTGSGKTTTLHACLSIKARQPISIITLEDPIEYEIAGIRQVHARESSGVTFSSGLRAAVRQDPDIIMVGEIRDRETARVAVHTALTGHLVLSTIHTGSASEVLTRLVDMGVDRYLIAATIRLIIGQRLVRTICRECFGVGCTVCRHSGYAGRSIIAEVFSIDEAMKKIIADSGSLSACQEYASAHGFRPMSEDGAEKVQWGITTPEEIIRVLST